MNSAFIITLLFIIFLFLFMRFIRSKFHSKEKARSEAFAALAKELNMSFYSKANNIFRNRLKGFYRFGKNRGQKYRRIRSREFQQYRLARIRNILRETKNNAEIIFFECSPLGGNNRIGVMEEFFYFRAPALKLPDFCLHQCEPLQQSFLGASGLKNINFESNPKFSEKYLLVGDDDGAITKLFNKKLLDFIESIGGFNVEGNGNELIVYWPSMEDQLMTYRRKTRLDLNDFNSLKQQATKVFEHFCT